MLLLRQPTQTNLRQKQIENIVVYQPTPYNIIDINPSPDSSLSTNLLEDFLFQ